jgi:ABC-type sugar transport system ATPase subunit
MSGAQSFLEMRGITKRFPGTVALNKVNLELRTGEILGLLGENGAGKSTLIKILSGAYQPDEGEIYIQGERQKFASPKEASGKGIGIIYQELNYLNDLTVAENIFLNRLPRTRVLRNVDWKRMKADAQAILTELKSSINPGAAMRELSVSEKQIVEIAKAISQDLKFLVMDEPTSALSERETELLLDIVKQMTARGVGVIYISHRIEELFHLAGRVQILRDGEVVGERRIETTSRDELVSLMVGRKVDSMYPKRDIAKGEEALRVQSLCSSGVRDISFSIRKGEILGVFGLMGAGQTEMAKAVFGAVRKTTGEIHVEGRRVSIGSPSDAIAAGIAYLSDERKADGLILVQSVKQNISTASLKDVSRPLRIDGKKESRNAEEWRQKLGIKTPSVDAAVEYLSGGNQQKVVLAKWLQTDPKVLILNNPTRGIDVGAKSELYNLMEAACEKGLGVLMISYELPEILQLSDRVLVMCEGRLTAELNKDELTQEKLMHIAVGEK